MPILLLPILLLGKRENSYTAKAKRKVNNLAAFCSISEAEPSVIPNQFGNNNIGSTENVY